jgi:hypothetical protein
MAGAVMLFAFIVIADLAVFSLSYVGFVIGALMVVTGLIKFSGPGTKLEKLKSV